MQVKEALIVVLCVGLFSAAGCRQELHHDLTERSANEIIVALSQSSIPAQKSESGELWKVSVPSFEYQRALTVMAARNLPREETDVFALLEKSGSMVPSMEEEYLRKVSVITTELEQTFLAIDSVVDAHVHAVLPRSGGVRDRAKGEITPGASVMIAYRAGAIPPGDESIRAILMGAIPSLSEEHISSVLVETEMPKATTAQLVAVGPFTVSSGSARGFRWLLISLFVCMLLVVAAVAGIRFRSTRQGSSEEPVRAPLV